MRPPMTDDELMHFGIEGMKWGRRRYQNPDGSLTPAGEARYGKKPGFLTRHKNKKKMAKVRAAKKAREDKSYNEPESKTKDLSDKELNSRVDRLKKEQEYKKLMSEVRHPGRSAVKKALGEVGTKLLKDAAIKVGEHYLEQFLKKRGIGVSESAKIDKQVKRIDLEMKKLSLQEKQYKVKNLGKEKKKKKKKK